MAKKSVPQNGHERLEEAISMLVQNQAALLARVAETDRAHVEFERRHLEFERETATRFARIEAQMTEIIRVLGEHGRMLGDHGRMLSEHGRMLERLPDAVRDKIGFKAQP